MGRDNFSPDSEVGAWRSCEILVVTCPKRVMSREECLPVVMPCAQIAKQSLETRTAHHSRPANEYDGP